LKFNLSEPASCGFFHCNSSESKIMPIDFSDLVPQGGPPPRAPLTFDEFLPKGSAAAQAAPAQSGGPMAFDEFLPKAGGTLNFDDLIPANAGATGKGSAPVVSASDTAADVAKSGGTGVMRGIIGLAGLPGDVARTGAQGLDIATRFVQRHLGLEESEPYDPNGPTLTGHHLPGGASIQSHIENLTGPFYQPQTRGGRFAESIGEFAPAIFGGPEGIGARLLGRVVAPAVTSEGLGEATEGTAAEPFARIGGALLGAGAGGALQRGMREAPTAEELQAAISGPGRGYNDPAIRNLQFTPQAEQDLADQIEQRLTAARIDQFNAPGPLAAVDRLRAPRFGPALTVDDLEAARQDARTNPATANPAEQRAGPIVRDVIDNYLNGNVPQAHLLAGDANAANAALVEARGNFAANARATDVSNALGRAENQAGSTYSGHNLDNATRQQLRPILNQKEGVSKTPAFQDYTDDEIAALRGSVNGNWLRNSIRDVGKQLGGGGGLGNITAGLGTGVTAHEAGADPMTSIGLGVGAMLGGRALGGLANRMTAAEAERMAALLRSRSPLANQMAPRPVPVRQNLLRGAVLSLPAAQGRQ
jgi:hypothetical protein